MKIVHIQQYYNENYGYQENILPQYQQALGHDVVMLTSTKSNDFCIESGKEENIDFFENEVKVKRINIKGEFKERFVLFDNLYSYIESEKPDYIFHHSVTAPSLLTVCKYKKNNPKCFLATDNHADLNISGRNKVWKVIYYNILWKKILSWCEKYIDISFGVTPLRCIFMEEELRISKKKIRLLPIGADINNAEIKISKEDLFEKYNINTNNFIIIHGGKITTEKQADNILNAFKRIKNEKINLVLFGDIKDSKIKELIIEDKRIVFIGWLNREDTLAILKYSDVGIWNTQHTTLLEDCIAVGLPMILRYYGSTCHLIDNTGLFLYEGSIREIYDKLTFVIENKFILKQFKENNHDLLKLLSYRNIAKESLNYYKSKEEQATHSKFMSIDYADIYYKYFRIINH